MTVCYNNVIYGPTVDSDPTNAANVSIPYTGKPRLSIKPVYADDGITIKYYAYELKVSATIYSAFAVLADIEDEVARIKKILSTPRLMLKMYPCGLGTTPIVNGIAGTIGTNRTPDLTYGPHPTELSVIPSVTNQAIDIEWSVTANISHCSTGFANNLVQFVSELDIDVDEDGNIAFLQRVIYESAYRVTDLTPFNEVMNSFAIEVGKSFQGMHQSKSTHQSMDGRTLTFEARYKEIPSDSAFHPYTTNIEAEDEMASSLLGDGFYKWHRRITAKITLPARIHKAWGYVIFKKILKERLRNLEKLDKKKAADALKPGNQNDDLSGTKNWYICLKMKFKNSLYTRMMSFDFEYLTCTTLDKLLSKSLICSRVNTGFRMNGIAIEDTVLPNTLSEQWLVWDTSIKHTVNGVADYEQAIPVSYTQCSTTSVQPVPQSPTIAGTKVLPLEDDPDITLTPTPGTSPGDRNAAEATYQNTPDTLEGIPTAYSWVDYKNGFELIQNQDNIQTSYLQATPADYYQNRSPDSGIERSTVGFSIENDSSGGADSGYEQPETIARSISTCKIRMKGYAIRAGHSIPTPVLTSVKGIPVQRTDESRITHRQIAQSDIAPVYLSMWDIVYNVNGNIRSEDIGFTMKSTGQPGYYT